MKAIWRRILAADIQAAGGALSVKDLAPFRAHLREPLSISYRGGKVFATPELTAGPTLSRTLGLLQDSMKPAVAPPMPPPTSPMPRRCKRPIASASRTWSRRRRALGAEALAPACTTHFSAVDRDGNMAAVTQTLLSTFGAKFVGDRHHLEQRHHVVRPDPGHAEFARARQALPHQLHAGTSAISRRKARGRRRLRRSPHPAGGGATSVVRDGLRHGPQCGDPPAPASMPAKARS